MEFGRNQQVVRRGADPVCAGSAPDRLWMDRAKPQNLLSSSTSASSPFVR